jgi:hypothetical protein
LDEPALALRVGSNSFRRETRQRILAAAAAKYSYPKAEHSFPLIAVTVRTSERVCTNLAELVERVYEEFLPHYPTIGFVVDGWVFSETDILDHSHAATCMDRKFIARMTQEFAAAREIFKNIPSSAIVRNLIGHSILDSISGLLDIDLYISHVGTLQHKIAFFSLAGGLVHGPKAQLSTLDSGTFQAELGKAPRYLTPSMVEDMEGGARDPARTDYRIVDIEACLSQLRSIIATT